MRIKAKQRTLALILIYAAVLLTGVFFAYRLWQTDWAMTAMPDTTYGQFSGPADAKKVIVEFMDYRCMYCRQVEPVMKEVLARHPDLKIIYRHYPVLGKQSIIEAGIALAAGAQGKYQEMHDFLMSREEPFPEAEIETLPARFGMDKEKFLADRTGAAIGYHLLETIDIVEALGINSTPSFMIGNTLYAVREGMPTADTFDKLLADEYGTGQ